MNMSGMETMKLVCSVKYCPLAHKESLQLDLRLPATAAGRDGREVLVVASGKAAHDISFFVGRNWRSRWTSDPPARSKVYVHT